MDYIEVSLKITPQKPWSEILPQELADIGFDSFTEENNQIQAYVPKEDFNQQKLDEIIKKYTDQGVEIQHKVTEIPYQNWNATWEADYQPITIDKDLLIRAPFHEKDDTFKLSIEIQPQMSFGTGHHQTTYLLSQALLNMDLKSKDVLDVGTGTGILGIISSKLGAHSVFGNDIDEYAVENAEENCQRNEVNNFIIKKGSIEVVPKEKFDVIIANINRNVLIQQMEAYADLAKQGCFLLLSGFYENDAVHLIQAAEKLGFNIIEMFTKETWTVLKFVKL